MCFRFQNVVLIKNVLSFSKCSSFKMWKLCERFREVFFIFPKKNNCKQKSFDFAKICSHFKELYWWGRVKNDEIYINFSNLFQLSRIYNSLYSKYQVKFHKNIKRAHSRALLEGLWAMLRRTLGRSINVPNHGLVILFTLLLIRNNFLQWAFLI